MKRLNLVRLLIPLAFPILPPAVRAAESTAIVLPATASWAETLAAHEARRYIYLRTGNLFPIVTQVPQNLSQDLIVVARTDRALGFLQSQLRGAETLGTVPAAGYRLQTSLRRPGDKASGSVLWLVGADDTGTLYAAYRFAERLGIRFYLHDDVVPDTRVRWSLPQLNEEASPLFAVRGIQPFHDFPEGPDWWDRSDYLAIIGQLPKLRMNFIGLHTYPENRPNAEPTVWIGSPADIGKGGEVSFSYPSSYQNTVRGNWGYHPKKTSGYLFGSAALFDRDDFGPEVMNGFLPAPTTAEANNAVFARTAGLLHDAFGFARQLGVKTCVGTETPLVVPKLVQDRLKAQGKDLASTATVQELYEGIFRRAAQAYPLDYYWFWSPENWTWSGTKDSEVTAATNDLFAAVAAYKRVAPPFKLATCGWVLGPQQDRAMFDKVLPKDIAVSCINREVGKTPVEPGFAEVKGRGKWAIPWMEDDPALTSPQLWAGRMRRDAADALRYGCDGLLGIHWRTRVLAPNVAALAQAAWNQQPWVASYKPPEAAPPTRLASLPGGNIAGFPANLITGTDEPEVYSTVRYNLSGYHLPCSNGICKVVLKFCEPHYGEAGKRVFNLSLQGRQVITNLDIFARVGKNRPLDFTFDGIEVNRGWLDVNFSPVVEFPSIAAIDISGPGGFRKKINCGGPAWKDYAADNAQPPSVPQVYADTTDFYSDWAQHEFGVEVAKSAAEIFTKIDCHLPVPSFWVEGPGGISPNPAAWTEAQKSYQFVDAFAALKPNVRGAGNQERFAYWLNTFTYLRDIAHLNCAWGEYNRVMDSVRKEKDPARQKQMARQTALPARGAIVQVLQDLYGHLLAAVTTPGELGTLMNWNQHNLRDLLDRPGEELKKILGEPLPPSAEPDFTYRGPSRIILPAKRTSVARGEALNLRVLLLSEQLPRTAEVLWRSLGEGKFAALPLRHVNRGVYTAELPPAKGDYEYFIRADFPKTGRAVYPPTAPELNRTVVVTPSP